jgi:hypothetical protein
MRPVLERFEHLINAIEKGSFAGQTEHAADHTHFERHFGL